jgi:hypothetical protein
MATAGILGVVLLALYGDRTPYYQHPVTYKQGYTKLTPLGQVSLRNRVINDSILTFLSRKKYNSALTFAQNTSTLAR